MNVSVTKQMEKMVRELVDSGRYGSASEVVRDALRLLEEQEWLRRAAREGLEAADRGEVVDGRDALRRLRQKAVRAVRGAEAKAGRTRRRAG